MLYNMVINIATKLDLNIDDYQFHYNLLVSKAYCSGSDQN